MPCYVIWRKQGIQLRRRENDFSFWFPRTGKSIAGYPDRQTQRHCQPPRPQYLRNNQLPSYETNCIEEWETKLDKIVEETINQDMTLISGIPPWMQMYFDRLRCFGERKSKICFPTFPCWFMAE